jgi:hypothetical protein
MGKDYAFLLTPPQPGYMSTLAGVTVYPRKGLTQGRFNPGRFNPGRFNPGRFNPENVILGRFNPENVTLGIFIPGD